MSPVGCMLVFIKVLLPLAGSLLAIDWLKIQSQSTAVSLCALPMLSCPFSAHCLHVQCPGLHRKLRDVQTM